MEVTGVELPARIDFPERFKTGHPRTDGYSPFIPAGLPVIGGLDTQIPGMPVQESTVKLLIESDILLRTREVLHTDIHKNQRTAQLRDRVEMIPGRLHGLVRLAAVLVESAAVGVLVVLIEGRQQMELVLADLESGLEHIVLDGRHRPIVSADDTQVVIEKFLPAYLGKETDAAVQGHPAFIQAETASARSAPDAGMPGRDLHFQDFVLVMETERRAAHQKVSVVHTVVILIRQRTVTDLAARPVLAGYGEGVGFRRHGIVLCGSGRRHQQQDQEGKRFFMRYG